VKPFFSLSRFTAISMLTTAVSLLAACGQTGPLYLPNKPVADAAPAAADPDISQQSSKPVNPASQ
jgi:predicted small lipoprotein YifL